PVATVYNWRTSGYGPRGFRVGKYLRYRLADVEAWEDAQVAAEADR
ncbi:excisionase, partial [Micrococcus luteus]